MRQELFIDALVEFDGALTLFNWLRESCDVAIVGGAVRTVLTGFKSPIKDFDCCVIVNDRKCFNTMIEHYNVTRNSFGGYKIQLENIDFDIWELHTSVGSPKSFKELQYKTHLNFDGIVYDYENDILYAEPFYDCVNSKTIKCVNKEGRIPGYNKRKSKQIQDKWGFKIELD